MHVDEVHGGLAIDGSVGPIALHMHTLNWLVACTWLAVSPRQTRKIFVGTIACIPPQAMHPSPAKIFLPLSGFFALRGLLPFGVLLPSGPELRMSSSLVDCLFR